MCLICIACVSRSVIVLKLQSCDKKFLFRKQPVNLSDVGKVVPNKGEELPYGGSARKVDDQSSKKLDAKPFEIFE